LQDFPQTPLQENPKVLLRIIHGGHFNMAENRTFLLCVDSDDEPQCASEGGRYMKLLRLCTGSPSSGALIEGLTEQGFDDGLAADIEFFGEAIEFVEHRGGEIYVNALDGLPAAAGISEEAADVLAGIGEAGDGFRGYRFLFTRCVFHKACALASWLSKE
ncbi:MAG: hypothetical protein ACRD36_00175, partial [Candidatus Acidiferrum sp.]